MNSESKPIITLEPITFKVRFLKSLISPWVFIIIGILVFYSFKIALFWISTILFLLAFIFMNYKANEQFLAKIEFKGNSIKLIYYDSKMKRISLEIPKHELTVECYGNGMGISSLVSYHMRIDRNGQTILKQYETIGWTTHLLKETTEKLKRFIQLK